MTALQCLPAPAGGPLRAGSSSSLLPRLVAMRSQALTRFLKRPVAPLSASSGSAPRVRARPAAANSTSPSSAWGPARGKRAFSLGQLGLQIRQGRGRVGAAEAIGHGALCVLAARIRAGRLAGTLSSRLAAVARPFPHFCCPNCAAPRPGGCGHIAKHVGWR